MATYGRIEEYNARSEKWENYLDRLEEYFIANDIQNDQRKRAILNSTVGPETFKLICDLLAPTKPKDSTYDDITSKLKKHFSPIKSSIVARSQFDSMIRRSEQSSVADFIAELRAVAKDCNYGEELDKKLRDRLVCGINDARIKRSLLAQDETKLDFKRATEIAVSMQFADEQSRVLTNSVDNVNALYQRQGTPVESIQTRTVLQKTNKAVLLTSKTLPVDSTAIPLDSTATPADIPATPVDSTASPKNELVGTVVYRMLLDSVRRTVPYAGVAVGGTTTQDVVVVHR